MNFVIIAPIPLELHAGNASVLIRKRKSILFTSPLAISSPPQYCLHPLLLSRVRLSRSFVVFEPVTNLLLPKDTATTQTAWSWMPNGGIRANSLLWMTTR